MASIYSLLSAEERCALLPPVKQQEQPKPEKPLSLRGTLRRMGITTIRIETKEGFTEKDVSAYFEPNDFSLVSRALRAKEYIIKDHILEVMA